MKGQDQSTVWPLVARFLVDNNDIATGTQAPRRRSFSATALLLLSKQLHQQCVPVIYHNVNVCEYSAFRLPKSLLDKQEDGSPARDRKRAYRQAIVSFSLKYLPRTSTALMWQSGLDCLWNSLSQDPMFPSLKIIKVNSMYIKHLVLYLEAKTPRHSSRPHPDCFHPFTAVLVRLYKDRPSLKFAIREGRRGKWDERHFKSMILMELWDYKTGIRGIKEQTKVSAVDHAWKRVAGVGNKWAINEFKQIPKRSTIFRQPQASGTAIA